MSMLLTLRTCHCNHICICVCKTPKFKFLTDISVFPISSRPWSDSDVSEPPVPILGTMPSSGPPVPILGMTPSSEPPVPVLNKPPSSGPPVPVLNMLPSSGTPVPVLVKTPSSINPTCPEPGTSLLL